MKRGLSFRLAVLTLLAAGACWAAGNDYAVRVSVYFSPDGGCAAAILRELDAARKCVQVQAYGFTNKAIAKALVEAKRRGVAVEAVLDDSNSGKGYTAATFLTDSGIPTFIDAAHAIAHNKIMIVDDATVITGSFNFTTAAEERNAENLLVLRSRRLAATYRENYLLHRAHSLPYERP